MKKMMLLGLIFAQLTGMAAEKNAELLCVWNYKTLYKSTPSVYTTSGDDLINVQNYFFFSDQTFVKAGLQTSFEEVLRMKKSNAGRWITVDNNLILLDNKGKQEMGVMAFNGQPAESLLQGEKEIIREIYMKSGAVPEPYNDVLAFSPQ